MDKKIKLIPGICDTKNRHYLPEKLLDGKTTVNENGNNSQVYPGNLKESGMNMFQTLMIQGKRHLL